MTPHEGAINASRRKNWYVATEIILRRDAKNNASRWKNSHFTAIFHPIAMHSTELSHEAPHALKGQKLLAQGSALGIMDANLSPCKGKSFVYRLVF